MKCIPANAQLRWNQEQHGNRKRKSARSILVLLLTRWFLPGVTGLNNPTTPRISAITSDAVETARHSSSMDRCIVKDMLKWYEAYYSICRIRLLLKGNRIEMEKPWYNWINVQIAENIPYTQSKISQTFPIGINIGLKQCDVISTILFNIYIKNLPGRWPEDNRSLNTINDIPYLVDTKINSLFFWDDLANHQFFRR